MKQYKAVLLDLFDTLVDLDYEKIPLIQLRGEAQRSTAGVVYQALREDDRHISFEQFVRAFRATYHELEALKKKDHREMTAQERFHRLLQRLGIESPPSSLVERLIAAHMDKMFEAMRFPAERRAVLEALRPQYRLALVSNFDHPPTAYRLLDHYELTPYFDTIVISAEVGWRKPGREIFLAALLGLDALPGESLHVGDTLWADVLGAQQAGLRAVWLNRWGQPLTEGDPQPDYVIERLEELLPILQIESS